MHFLRLLDIAIPVISSFRVIQLLNHFLQCDFWDNSATLGTALTSPIAHSLTQTDPSWKQWSGCGLQHYIGTLTASVTSAPLRKESYKNTWCNTGFHLFWVEFRVSPSEASKSFPFWSFRCTSDTLHAILSVGPAGPQDQRQTSPSLVSTTPPSQCNAHYASEAELRM